MTALRRPLRFVWWYLRELTGEAGYDRYVARHRSDHPDTPPLSRRDYERLRAARQQQGSINRCC